jgi:hypothetical protein
MSDRPILLKRPVWLTKSPFDEMITERGEWHCVR